MKLSKFIFSQSKTNLKVVNDLILKYKNNYNKVPLSLFVDSVKRSVNFSNNSNELSFNFLHYSAFFNSLNTNSHIIKFECSNNLIINFLISFALKINDGLIVDFNKLSQLNNFFDFLIDLLKKVCIDNINDLDYNDLGFNSYYLFNMKRLKYNFNSFFERNTLFNVPFHSNTFLRNIDDKGLKDCVKLIWIILFFSFDNINLNDYLK